MTPKEKARNLVDKFIEEGICFVGDYSMEKSCAMVVVDELIYETQFEVPNIRQRYWMKVKQEIEKL